MVSGYPGISLLGLSVYLYTRTQRNRLWYLGIQGISLLCSPYISINAHRETSCGIWVSRVSACWVFLYTSMHTYRETSSGIWVSRVSVCRPLRIYFYTHTEKQVVVSGYPGYQSAVLSIDTYRETSDGIWVSSVLACCVFLHVSIHTYRETSHGIWVSSVSTLWVFMYVSIHTCRETSCSIWVSRVSKCRFCLYWVDNKHTQASGSIRISRVSKYLAFLHVKTYVHRGWPWYQGIKGIRILRLSLCKDVDTPTSCRLRVTRLSEFRM